MKKYTLFLATTILLVMINSCAGLKVTSDYDKNANFSKYKTFAIDTFRQSESVSQLNQQRVLNAVITNMKSKGYTESNTPDLLVHISAIIKNKKSVSSTTDGFGYGYGGFYRPYGWGGNMTSYTTYDVYDYKDGSLIIDVADAATKKLLWEGIGNKEIDGPIKDPDTVVPQAVAQIMQSLPAVAAAK